MRFQYRQSSRSYLYQTNESCNEHMQARKYGQRVFCGTHYDTLQLPQGEFFLSLLEEQQGLQSGGQVQVEEMSELWCMM